MRWHNAWNVSVSWKARLLEEARLEEVLVRLQVVGQQQEMGARILAKF